MIFGDCLFSKKKQTETPFSDSLVIFGTFVACPCPGKNFTKKSLGLLKPLIFLFKTSLFDTFIPQDTETH